MKLYDAKNKQLLIFEARATSEYWDKHWELDNFADQVKRGSRLVKRFTHKFLAPGARILEGGCGIGQNVYGLKNLGYDVYGVDSAPETVARVKKAFTELQISVQDVRKLDFPNGFFDGYWSLGVIEHFWNGYGSVINEAKRVLVPGGYFFVTFPYMSPLRKTKAAFHVYKELPDDKKSEGFYEFILDWQEVRRVVESNEFVLRKKYAFSATKGIKDEISFTKPILQRIFDSRTVAARGIQFVLSEVFSGAAGHSTLLIFQKK